MFKFRNHPLVGLKNWMKTFQQRTKYCKRASKCFFKRASETIILLNENLQDKKRISDIRYIKSDENQISALMHVSQEIF